MRFCGEARKAREIMRNSIAEIADDFSQRNKNNIVMKKNRREKILTTKFFPHNYRTNLIISLFHNVFPVLILCWSCDIVFA